MADRITYVGLDVHKEGIVVAVAAGGLRGGWFAGTSGKWDHVLSPISLPPPPPGERWPRRSPSARGRSRW
jgi:hypothetical protein